MESNSSSRQMPDDRAYENKSDNPDLHNIQARDGQHDSNAARSNEILGDQTHSNQIQGDQTHNLQVSDSSDPNAHLCSGMIALIRRNIELEHECITAERKCLAAERQCFAAEREDAARHDLERASRIHELERRLDDSNVNFERHCAEIQTHGTKIFKRMVEQDGRIAQQSERMANVRGRIVGLELQVEGQATNIRRLDSRELLQDQMHIETQSKQPAAAHMDMGKQFESKVDLLTSQLTQARQENARLKRRELIFRVYAKKAWKSKNSKSAQVKKQEVNYLEDIDDLLEPPQQQNHEISLLHIDDAQTVSSAHDEAVEEQELLISINDEVTPRGSVTKPPKKAINASTRPKDAEIDTPTKKPEPVPEDDEVIDVDELEYVEEDDHAFDAFVPPQFRRQPSTIRFANHEHARMLGAATYVEDMSVDEYEHYWAEIAARDRRHTATQLRRHYEKVVRPQYLANLEKGEATPQAAAEAGPVVSGKEKAAIGAELKEQDEFRTVLVSGIPVGVSVASIVGEGPEGRIKSATLCRTAGMKLVGGQLTTNSALVVFSDHQAAKAFVRDGQEGYEFELVKSATCMK